MYVCMYVGMSVRNGFTIEVYGFMYSLRTFWHVSLRMPSRNGMEIEVEDSEAIEDNAGTSPDVWKTVNYST